MPVLRYKVAVKSNTNIHHVSPSRGFVVCILHKAKLGRASKEFLDNRVLCLIIIITVIISDENNITISSIQVPLAGRKSPAPGLSGCQQLKPWHDRGANGILASLRGLHQSHSLDQGEAGNLQTFIVAVEIWDIFLGYDRTGKGIGPRLGLVIIIIAASNLRHAQR
jgi:hypothetical protein